MIKNILLVALGGSIGSVLRYLISTYMPKTIGSVSFPFGTLTANLAGCLMIGLFSAMALKGEISESTRLLLTVGLCGGFTTFSTFINENMMYLKADNILYFALYTGISVTLGLIAVWCGNQIGAKI